MALPPPFPNPAPRARPTIRDLWALTESSSGPVPAAQAPHSLTQEGRALQLLATHAVLTVLGGDGAAPRLTLPAAASNISGRV